METSERTTWATSVFVDGLEALVVLPSVLNICIPPYFPSNSTVLLRGLKARHIRTKTTSRQPAGAEDSGQGAAPVPQSLSRGTPAAPLTGLQQENLVVLAQLHEARDALGKFHHILDGVRDLDGTLLPQHVPGLQADSHR